LKRIIEGRRVGNKVYKEFPLEFSTGLYRQYYIIFVIRVSNACDCENDGFFWDVKPYSLADTNILEQFSESIF
jgi:hypothetical protein